MKRFKYRLQRVLQFKEAEKKDKERELALKNGELFRAEQELDNIIDQQDRAPLPASGEMSMAEITLQREFQEGLRAMLEEQRQLIIDAAAAVDAARNAYLEKAVETETLNTHREKRFENYRQENKRVERRAADELTIQRLRRLK